MDFKETQYTGKEFIAGTPEYEAVVQQYATSTYGQERNLRPAAIFQPKTFADVQWVVTGGNSQEGQSRPIAIRTGGHQYSGASSTGPPNIQLDLRYTFRCTDKDSPDHSIVREHGKTYLITSVSWTLKETFDFLKENKVFMPTGQCFTVCLGGHIQTGGYGMLARSFGLLGDYVREMTIVDYRGEKVVVTKESHADLFFGLLGGSPGNFGVLTHAKIEVQEDKDYQGSKGLWVAFPYFKSTYKKLLNILVEKAEDPEFPRGYDMTVNVVDRETLINGYWPGTRDEFLGQLPEDPEDGSSGDPNRPAVTWPKVHFPWIAVYAQWVNLGHGEKSYSSALFASILDVAKIKVRLHDTDNKPMSEIASWWLFKKPREFPYPYVKRTNTTNSLELSKQGWSDWFSERMTVAVKAKTLHVSSQLQVYSGPNSMFQKNGLDNGTSYCFRDATVGGTWDLFYSGSRDVAEEWQAETDKDLPKYFSQADRRVLWGSYGDWDMKKVWHFYYDEKTYKRLQGIRGDYDPKGLFTANPFCVEAMQKK